MTPAAQHTYKTGKKSGQLRPIKSNKPKKYAKEHDYIISCIDFEGYDIPNPENAADKMQALYNIFNSEYGWNIKRIGEFEALISWLRGLPTCCTIAFYNGDILKLAKSWGSLPDDATDKQEEKILESYWRFMAMRILGLWDKYKTVKERV